MHIEIDGRKIGAAYPPYVICELSANHNGNFDTALALMNAAAKTGADAIKVQTYHPDTITLNSDAPEFQITDGLWKGRTLYELYEDAHMPWDWHQPMFAHAKKLGITLFSSPFDSTAVDLLEDLGAPAYKIASFEAIDLPLIRYAAGTGKPMIISTGMANLDEIGEAIETARDAGCPQIALLHCISAYPASPGDYNLRTIADMADRFGTVVGLSDHTLDNVTAITSIACGASVIEKHFTLDRDGGGPDDSFSLEPDGFTSLCRDTKIAWKTLGQIEYGQHSSEQGNVLFRRSLYFVKDLAAGDTVTAGDVRSVRPGFGIAPKWLDDVIGRKIVRAVSANTAVSFDDLASR